jgi:hypothetical protein
LTQTTGWAALLPALSSGYIKRVDFVSPLDIDFPPVSESSPEPLAQLMVFDEIEPAPAVMGQSPPTPPLVPLVSTTVSISPPEMLKGWTVSIQDPTTRRVVSSQPVVQDGNASIQWLATGVLAGLSSATQLSGGGYDIVVSPPPGSVGLPELVDSYQGSPEENYPLLPKPVTISGTVGPAAAPVSATLHFVSTALYNYLPSSSPPMCTLADSDAPLLHYDVVVATEDQIHPGGAVGKYSVVLPPGTYTITVEPDATSGFAKTQVQPSGDASSGIELPVSGDPCSTTKATYDIPLERLLNVTGQVLIADGRFLANATVDLTPSVVPPPSMPSSSSPPATLGSPRPFKVTTGDDGSFTASVDPGTYDVTVRPVDGTRLPWIVSPAHVISGNTTLERLYVPAPQALNVTLHDPLLDSPIAQAVVRAYAFTGCTAPPGGACHGVALQIGQGFTDVNGSFEIFLTPVPFTPQNP